MSIRVACVGGGPGGLFFATLLKQANPAAEVTVLERNRADDTFGFGVVFSDRTLANIHEADPVLLQALTAEGTHWDEIEIRLKGERLRAGGNGMAAISRKTLLGLMQRRAAEVGVDLHFQREVTSLAGLEEYDLVVAADGANSLIRTELADVFQPTADEATAKFIWFGTTYKFGGLTFVHVKNEHGVFAVHGYPISEDVSTFIVETDEDTWRRAGLDGFDVAQPPGQSDEKSRRYLEDLFAEQIDGHGLLVNNSRWANFKTRRSATWHTGNVALLGDAAHTAHFSVGAGTKMAMEDAIALAHALGQHDYDVPAALATYEMLARPSVERIQAASWPSLSWWEHFGRYHDTLDPTQFAFHFMTRSLGRERLARRDPDFVAAADKHWRAQHGADPIYTPIEVGGMVFPSRAAGIAVSGEDRRVCSSTAVDEPSLRLVENSPGDGGPWGLWLSAPEDETGLAAARERLRQALTGSPALVAVHGGTTLTRALLTEEARLVHGVTALMVEDAEDEDRALTLLLSGRADMVATLHPVELLTGARPGREEGASDE